jgi:hypothetical protein
MYMFSPELFFKYLAEIMVNLSLLEDLETQQEGYWFKKKAKGGTYGPKS